MSAPLSPTEAAIAAGALRAHANAQARLADRLDKSATSDAERNTAALLRDAAEKCSALADKLEGRS